MKWTGAAIEIAAKKVPRIKYARGLVTGKNFRVFATKSSLHEKKEIYHNEIAQG